MARVIVSTNPATLIEVGEDSFYFDGIPVATLTPLGHDWVAHNAAAWNDAEHRRHDAIEAMLREKYHAEK